MADLLEWIEAVLERVASLKHVNANVYEGYLQFSIVVMMPHMLLEVLSVIVLGPLFGVAQYLHS